jgi:hypothetical protein
LLAPAVFNFSADSAGLWQEGFALGGVLQTFGQQHFIVCIGQLLIPSVAFELALSRRPALVALELKATNTNTATMTLKIRRIVCMLKPGA